MKQTHCDKLAQTTEQNQLKNEPMSRKQNNENKPKLQFFKSVYKAILDISFWYYER